MNDNKTLKTLSEIIESTRKEERQNMIKMIDEQIIKEKRFFKKNIYGQEYCNLCIEDEGRCSCKIRVELLEELKSQLQSPDAQNSKEDTRELHENGAYGVNPSGLQTHNSQLQLDELDKVKGQTVKGANHISSNNNQTLSHNIYTYDGENEDGTPKLYTIVAGENIDGDLLLFKDVKDAIRKLTEDNECTGFRCPHEISERHFILTEKDILDIFGERLVEQ